MVHGLLEFDKKRFYFENYKKDNYYYQKMYDYLDNDSVPFFFNKKDVDKNNFILLLLVMQNKIFGHGEFSELYLDNFLAPLDTTFYKDFYDVYQNTFIRIGEWDINYRDKLLEYKRALKLNDVKNNFFSLSFNKKYYLVENFEDIIKSMFFFCCLAQFIDLDGSFFYTGLIKDKSTLGMLDIGSSNAMEDIFLKNYFFSTYVNVRNINELYASFLSYETFDLHAFKVLSIKKDRNFSVKLKDSKKFLFYKDFDSQLILSKQNKGVGVFSKKFSVSKNNPQNSMMFFLKKNGKNFEFYNVVKFIPYKKISIDISPKTLKNKIPITFNKEYNSYDFGKLILKPGTISKVPLEIYFSYIPSKNITVVNVKDTSNNKKRPESMFYYIDKNNIFRILNGKKYKLAVIKTTKKDKIIKLEALVLPYEYIIISVMSYLYFYLEEDTQNGGGIMDFFKSNKYKDELEDFKTSGSINSEKHKLDVFDDVAAKCDSIIFKYYYYRAKHCEMLYFLDGFKKMYQTTLDDTLKCKKILNTQYNEMLKDYKQFVNNVQAGEVGPGITLKSKQKSGFIKTFGDIKDKDFMASRILCSFNINWSEYYYKFENKNKKLTNMSGGSGSIEVGNGNAGIPSLKKSQNLFKVKSNHTTPQTDPTQQAINDLKKLQKTYIKHSVAYNAIGRMIENLTIGDYVPYKTDVLQGFVNNYQKMYEYNKAVFKNKLVIEAAINLFQKVMDGTSPLSKALQILLNIKITGDSVKKLDKGDCFIFDKSTSLEDPVDYDEYDEKYKILVPSNLGLEKVSNLEDFFVKMHSVITDTIKPNDSIDNLERTYKYLSDCFNILFNDRKAMTKLATTQNAAATNPLLDDLLGAYNDLTNHTLDYLRKILILQEKATDVSNKTDEIIEIIDQYTPILKALWTSYGTPPAGPGMEDGPAQLRIINNAISTIKAGVDKTKNFTADVMENYNVNNFIALQNGGSVYTEMNVFRNSSMLMVTQINANVATTGVNDDTLLYEIDWGPLGGIPIDTSTMTSENEKLTFANLKQANANLPNLLVELNTQTTALLVIKGNNAVRDAGVAFNRLINNLNIAVAAYRPITIKNMKEINNISRMLGENFPIGIPQSELYNRVEGIYEDGLGGLIDKMSAVSDKLGSLPEMKLALKSLEKIENFKESVDVLKEVYKNLAIQSNNKSSKSTIRMGKDPATGAAVPVAGTPAAGTPAPAPATSTSTKQANIISLVNDAKEKLLLNKDGKPHGPGVKQTIIKTIHPIVDKINTLFLNPNSPPELDTILPLVTTLQIKLLATMNPKLPEYVRQKTKDIITNLQNSIAKLYPSSSSSS